MTEAPIVETFGHLPDGRVVERITLQAEEVRARFVPLGAMLQSLEVPDRTGRVDDIVLGHDDLASYLTHRACFGTTVGRVANRIAGGRFSIDGEAFEVDRNEGENTLHGGAEGWDRRLWTIEEVSASSVTFGLVSEDGDQGFPGRVTARVRYTLTLEGAVPVLRIEQEAETDRPTPVAMTNHSYFALAGIHGLAGRPRSALEYWVKAPAARYLPVDAATIPLAPAPVAATPFDFRTGRQPVTAVRAGALSGYDHHLCLDAGPDGLARIAVWDAESGRRIVMETDQPGVQIYTGNFLDGTGIGKLGQAYRQNDAICLEPQIWPNAVNMPAAWGAGEAVLRPGERFRATIVLRFDTVAT